MKRFYMICMVFLVMFLTAAPLMAASTLNYSCSNQVYKAFAAENVAAFSLETGIGVDVHSSSSNSALYRLMNGYADIAATARALYLRQQDYGFSQIPFCRDPLAVIARSGCGVQNVTRKQLEEIFSGAIRNWKEIGGADLPIIVIVPGKDTAANKNFRRQVMGESEIRYDIVVYASTMAIEVVKHFPCGAVSFISQGAIKHQGDIRALTIDGYAPDSPDYPYFQKFYYVIKGAQSGPVKRFIDFTFSPEGARIIRKNGMLPISRPR